MADGSGMPPALPALGETRCYWAIMDSGMNFRYVDPVLQGHLSEQASSIIGKNLVDFIHPEEKPAARDDFSKFKTSTTIFGSVTRCRYSRISNARRILGADDLVAPGGFENKVLDEQWANARIVASVVAENTVLTFFHVTRDVDSVADNDDVNLSHWSNWCGPRLDELGKHYFTAAQIFMLGEALKYCQNTSDELMEKSNQPNTSSKTTSPAYVFQILGTKSDAIHISWPPPNPTGEKEDLTMHGPAPEGQSERYSVNEYATLARGVISKPREKRTTGDAQTNCTKRFQSKHPITRDGLSTTIESVVISYQDITFVCFQSDSSSNKAGSDQGSKAGKRKEPDPDNPMMAALKKARAGKSKATSDAQSATTTSDFDMNNWAQKFAQNPHPASPTVASASAILGSFSSQSPQSSGADPNNQSLQQQQNTSYQNIASPVHQSSNLNQSWTHPDQNEQGDQNISTTYYNSQAYPNVYSNMFAAGDGRTPTSATFMAGSTNIPPMPSPNTNASNGGNTPLQNLALASSSSYYSEYNAQQAYDMAEAAKIQSLQYATGPNDGLAPPPQPIQPAGPGGDRSPLVYTTRSVRKIDKNRICTSCGTTNSPEWRKGPSGIKTLCNACGLRYSRAQARKAKKAQKEADRIANLTASGNGTPSQNQGQSSNMGVFQPHDLNQNSAPANFTMPPPLSIPPGPSSAPSGSHSPYMNMGEYGNPHSAPLPPLPIDSQSINNSGAEGDNSQNNNDNGETGNDTSGNGQQTHPGSTAPNYGGYGSFVNYTPYGEWSPASNQSFSSQQAQTQNTNQGQASQGGN